jgi:hypothetical protein
VDRYRVQVDKVLIDEDGDYNYQSVVDLTAERGQLARFAPAVVAEALGASAASVTVQTENSIGCFPPVEHVADDEPATAEADKPKRRRRTKAEMEADRLAELGATNAAEANAVAAPVAVTPPSAPAAADDTGDWNPFG